MHFALFILLIAAPPPPADAENAPIPGEDRHDRGHVEGLVRQLGSPVRRQRERAAERLKSANPVILESLPLSSPDPAVARALGDIRQSLELRAARQAAQPTTLTLQGGTSAAGIERAILKQTGQTVRFDEAVQADQVELNWKATPFWEAVRQLETSTMTTAVGDSATNAIILRRQETGTAAAVASSGACRIELVRSSMRPNLVNPALALLQVRWRVRAEPRLRPLYLVIADRDCSLTSGTTRFSLLSPDARREIPCDRWEGCEVDTAFQMPRDVDAAATQFAASANLKVAALPLKLQFRDLAAAAPSPQRRGAATGVIRGLRFEEAAKTLSFRLTVSYERGGPEFESHRMWIYRNSAWLNHQSGEKRAPESVELKENAGSGATLEYRFAEVAGPLKDLVFVYEAPSLVIDVPILVEGLPVPASR